MTRILILGDTHIPDRAERIPQPLVKLVESELWDYVLFTGDFTSLEVKTWVERLGKKTFAVKGNMDYLPYPTHQRIIINDHVFGVFHGHGVSPRGDVKKLAVIAESIKADVLVTGHTHLPFVKSDPSGRVLLLNPGSATGAWSGELESGPPSIMLVEAKDQLLEIKLVQILQDSLHESVFIARKRDKWIIHSE
ncbi:YfcE family phosphodiesterase [Thermosphaera aggregans]|uniref:Phosphoesterase n=1 Tax=Thermosphaera aggregans (strain DSM 11486 / M11TL) TaxID=633148 RepID=D5U0Y6_THEAM|nr:YfcE family phosphodiesterase [Thermosphaera aggregans]ADG90786.1 phosphodiesterase, MJ0936 family [Thermosphaera aggregans DSM 11486]